MAGRVYTFKETEIKPLLDMYAKGIPVDEIAKAMSKPEKVVKDKLIRMGYMTNGCPGCEWHFKKVEARLEAVEFLVNRFASRSVARKSPRASVRKRR